MRLNACCTQMANQPKERAAWVPRHQSKSGLTSVSTHGARLVGVSPIPPASCLHMVELTLFRLSAKTIPSNGRVSLSKDSESLNESAEGGMGSDPELRFR